MLLTSAALGVAVICMGLFWARRNLVVVSVEGASMEPAVRHGDRVLVRRRRLHRVRTGDIVVLEPPSDGPYRTAATAGPDGRIWNVKRVAALPGDPLPPGVPGEGQVGPGTFAVLGDNRADSIDSRHRGLFPAERLMGVVVRTLSAR
ncbi:MULTISPECIES: S26 family signal peptidase [unclassified Streptomyces]|uniref:S26 family signal peptidase n=1 Tax=unclassified Streptomyces TaxID=2593676 RepID=UPI0027879E2B|nr:S26 family signal peptidase [Streptomyces sp. V1I6]MDQ0843512.1 signal peptidase I [Streptomyces sp. V1I6]